MSYIFKKKISTGVTWVAIEEADLYICCGCPADTVKHLKKQGVIQPIEIDGVKCENGPNAILLSDALIQNGQVANLTEFLILQMLYMQGVRIPGHPNYQKWKPLIIGYRDQIQLQLDYVTVGNHGLSSVEEIMDGGVTLEDAKKIYATKLHYSGGDIMHMTDLVDTCHCMVGKREIRNGVFMTRIGINKFEISYKDEQVVVDLNIAENQHFQAPYFLPFVNIEPNFFSVTHTGEGNGWDATRPCMASVIHHNNHVYLIDAGPSILNNLSRLGIGLSEIDGIFLSHIHDDHFAGITELLNVERRLNLYTTKLIRHTAEKKLGALTNSDVNLIQVAFNCVDLEFNQWTDINGLEVKPRYSPHTVETNTFNFRVKDEDGYKTYTHLSDTINLNAFSQIVEAAPDVFSENETEYIFDSYLSSVTLKKVDVGGGAIHGHLSDYDTDDSDMVVMAHTSRIIDSDKENFVNVDFGTTHHLIEREHANYLDVKSRKYLRSYFNMVDEQEIEVLASQKVRSFVPGELIINKANADKIYLVVRGLIAKGVTDELEDTLDAGNFIGYSKRYFRDDLPESYTAWSYVQCIEYEETFFNEFIMKHGLIEDVQSRIGMMRGLRKSELFCDTFSNSIMNWTSKLTRLLQPKDFSFTNDELEANLYIITEGQAEIEFEEGTKVIIEEGQHFGGLAILEDYRRSQEFDVTNLKEIISIPANALRNVPKLVWRLKELEERRFQMSIFGS